MAEITMPRLSDTMQEGKVARWLKRPGDAVQRGEVLAEIETDKATMELEAFDAGVLERVLVREGETVPIGQPIAVVGAGSAAATSQQDSGAPATSRQDSDAVATAQEGRGAATTPTEESASAQAAPALDAAPPATASPPAAQRVTPEPREPTPAQVPATPQAPAAAAAPSEDGDDQVRASPMARAIARERGVDLRSIQGSGPSGRIIRADVEAAVDGAHTSTAAQAPSPAAAAAAAAPEAIPLPAPAATPESGTPPAPAAPQAAGPDVELRAVSRVHQIMAQRTLQSVREIPQYYLTIDIDMGNALDLRRQLQATFGDQGRVKVNDLVLRAAALALREVPEVNSSWQDGQLAVHRHVNLGIAVAVPDGLLVPVIRDADQKSLRQIAAESQALARRARDGKLQLGEMEGGTFSVSNLGMFDVEQFIGIVNPPQAGLLAVGAIVEKPTGVDGQVVLRPRLRATLSADHRAYSGDVGARFLQAFKRLLETPLRLGF